MSCAEPHKKIANARVAGMDEDLRLDVGSRYTTILLVFFITRFFFGVSPPLASPPCCPSFAVIDMTSPDALKHYPPHNG